MEFHDLSLTEIVALLQSGKASQKEVREHFLRRIDALDPKVEAFNHVNREFADAAADTALAGAPLGVKDLYCEKGVPTTASSKMLLGFKPPYDATAISKLKAAGFASLGKLNLDEFAMGGSGENSALRITKNPWDPTRIPGGSSAGSAAAVAAGRAPAALGTDTGGSIRQPAAKCGVVGFKPTYGRVSRWGVIAMASSLDTMGTFTTTVRDAGLLYGLMAGHDPMDATSLSAPHALDPKIWERKDLRGVRVGVPKEYFVDGIEAGVLARVNEALEEMKRLGAEIVEISLPYTKYGLAVYYLVMPAEVSTNLARYDGMRFGHANDAGLGLIDAYKKNRAEGFGKEAKRRIMLGAYALSSGYYDAYYRKASMVRELIKRDFAEAYKKVDVIACPTSPSVAWKIGEKTEDPVKMYLSDVYTVQSSLAGLPGISIPVGYAKPDGDASAPELPVGLQIVGPALGEEAVLGAAHVLEGALKAKVAARKPAAR